MAKRVTSCTFSFYGGRVTPRALTLRSNHEEAKRARQDAGTRVRMLGARRWWRAEVGSDEEDAVRVLIERHGARPALGLQRLRIMRGPVRGDADGREHPLAAGGEGEPRGRIITGAVG